MLFASFYQSSGMFPDGNIGDPLSTECARETFKKLFSSTLSTFQEATCIIVGRSFIVGCIYIYKEDAWKDAVKYREPDKNIG